MAFGSFNWPSQWDPATLIGRTAMPLSQLVPGSMDMNETPILPAHIEETIQSIAKLQAAHHSRSTPFQRAVERLTAVVARSTFVGSLTVAIVLWMAANVLAGWLHFHVVDAPP